MANKIEQSEPISNSDGNGQVVERVDEAETNRISLASNPTPEIREARILHDVEVLRDRDAPRFRRVAAQIAEMARLHALTLTGENHPLTGFLKKKPDPDSIKSLEEGMAEYRAFIEASERTNL